jgi:hypothetical protein
MRNLLLAVAAAVAVSGMLGCGPSGKEVAVAKTARYRGDKLVLFAAAKAATESKYKLQKSDETTLGLQTLPRWYTPEGVIATERNSEKNQAGTGYNSMYPDRSINIALVVRLLPEGDSWVVEVTPIMSRFLAGNPKPEQLDPKDPSVPGWATGQADQLQYAIYEALKQYEVKSPGGIAPAPAAPPAAPTPAPDPSAGSAAPAP